jgi:hypothetical protein
MGELPSQQPPDWWNRRSPYLARRERTRVMAAGVARTWRGGADIDGALNEGLESSRVTMVKVEGERNQESAFCRFLIFYS